METEFSINQITQRYNLPNSKDLLYSYEELKRMDVDQEFIYALLETFADESTFSEKEYQKFSLDIIIDYIHRTHTYYLGKKLPEIEQSILILLKDYSDNHPLLQILNSFFAEYAKDLNHHIKSEEKDLLPYIKAMIKLKNGELSSEKFNELTKNYTLKSFIDSHLDTEKELLKVRNAILEYQPPSTNQTPYRILLTQLAVFEKDLAVHALIEDEVLIPRALELENSLRNSN